MLYDGRNAAAVTEVTAKCWEGIGFGFLRGIRESLGHAALESLSALTTQRISAENAGKKLCSVHLDHSHRLVSE